MKKQVKEFIEVHTKNMLDTFKENDNSMIPIFALFTQNKEKDYCVNILPIPPELLDSEDKKDFIRHGLLESVKKAFKNQGHKLLCIGFTAEAVITKRMIKKNGEFIEKDTERKDILVFSYDTPDENKTITYEIKRDMKVGDDGLNENVELVLFDGQAESGDGRFSNLL